MGTREADIAAINALYDVYVYGLHKDDLELFMSVWADDALRMEQDTRPIVSNDSIKAHFAPFFARFSITCEIYGDYVVGVDGDLGYSHGLAYLDLTPKAGGPTMRFDAKWVDVLKRQADGSWKIYCDCTTYNGPPTEK